jgi:hypothetical protein
VRKREWAGHFRVIPEGEIKMVAVPYGSARVAAPTSAEAKAGAKRQGFFARFLAAIERSQLKRAERDLARYHYLLPLDHELRSGELVPHSEDKLPFGGW